ncbi:MAG: hypothetical protein AAF862_07745 [Pseudomonadota bacterium]
MIQIPRQILLPAAAIFQVAGAALPRIYEWGIDVGVRSKALDTAIVPAVWAFSIWGIIYLWCIAFSMYAATRPTARAELANTLTWPAIGVFTMNGIWALYTPMMGFDILSQVILITALVCGVFGAIKAGQYTPKSWPTRLLAGLPLGLLAGWLTAATFVGLSTVLRGAGLAITTPLLIGILSAGTLFAGLMITLRPPATYVLALLWALTAVVTKNLDAGNQAVLYTAAGAMLLIALTTVYAARRGTAHAGKLTRF